MIKVVAKFTVKEGKIEEFKSYASKLACETRNEVGCISYKMFQDVKDSKILTFIEEWESQEVLKNHMQSVHFKEIGAKLGEAQENEPDVNIYNLVV